MKLNHVYQRPSEMPADHSGWSAGGRAVAAAPPGCRLAYSSPRYLAMIDDALSGERLIGMIQPSDGEEASEFRPNSGAIVARAASPIRRQRWPCFITLTAVARFRLIGMRRP